MFEATAEALHLFGITDHRELGEDYTLTETRVVCHVADQTRLLQLREQFQLPVIYLPHPLLFAESSIRKASPPLCLILRKRGDTDSTQMVRVAREKGYRVATIDDNKLGLREKRRAYREAAIVIAYSFSDVWSEVLLCASKTPFLAQKLENKISLDYLRLSGVTEKVLDFSPSGFSSLVSNHSLFCENAVKSLARLFNLYTWPEYVPTAYTASGYAFIENVAQLQGQVILYPWIAYTTEDILDKNELVASKLMCAGLIFPETPHRLDWPWSVSPRTETLFKTWSGEILMLCADGTCVRYNLQTKRGAAVQFELSANEVLIMEAFDLELSKKAISLGIPFVSAPNNSIPDFLFGYEGIQSVRFVPTEIQKLLTPHYTACIATQILAIRKALLLKDL